MDIPNLSDQKVTKVSKTPQNPLSPVDDKPVTKTKPTNQINNIYLVIVALSGIFVSFWLSRFFPNNTNQSNKGVSQTKDSISVDQISSIDDIQVGKVYGQTDVNFSDTATGTIEKGSINGVGTHILNRPGGVDQRASLTSSVVDLDLFVDRKVEIKGETNASDKTSWLLDVGSVKVLE